MPLTVTYYLQIRQKEIEHTSLKAIRKAAIDHLLSTNRENAIVIYASSTKRNVVGEVIRRPTSRTVFVWRYDTAGHTVERPLLTDGAIRHSSEV